MTQVDRTAARTTVPALVRRAVSFELGVWRSLYRWTTRRPVGPAGTETFSYSGPVTPLIWAFIGLSAIEVPVAHLLLPWQAVRVIVLALGVWGLTWMLGLLASLKTYPHIVGDSGLRVRYGTTVDITIPWDAIATIGVRHRNLPRSRTVQLTQPDSGTVLHVGISSQTNVDVALRDPVIVALPKGNESIAALRFYADDARAIVARARLHLMPQR
ncbi:MAG: hypothetical protein ACRDTT_13230 [Pseudonocardiaceae bacterium]